MVSRAVGVVSRRPALFWLTRSDLPDEMDLREETGMMLPWDTDAGRKFFLLVLMMTLLSTPLWLIGEADAEVLISELCGDPASDWDGDGSVDSRGDEWIEIVNTGPETVDLAAYYLRDALGEEPHLRLSGGLAPGATALFTGTDAVMWQTAEGLSTSGLSLNNAGDLIQLYLGHPQDPSSALVDLAPYPDHAADDDRSIARVEGEWVLCDGLNPYAGTLDPVGTGCPPTPGAVNVCEGLVASQEQTWGEIKTLWR